HHLRRHPHRLVLRQVVEHAPPDAVHAADGRSPDGPCAALERLRLPGGGRVDGAGALPLGARAPGTRADPAASCGRGQRGDVMIVGGWEFVWAAYGVVFGGMALYA